MVSIIMLTALAACIAWLAYRGAESNRDGNWHFHNQIKMRRWDGQRWVYREMTQEEYDEQQSRLAW